MIAAIVVPAGARSVAMMRACLVSGRTTVFEDEGASRVRDLDLPVDREVERAAALGFDLGLVMGSSNITVVVSVDLDRTVRCGSNDQGTIRAHGGLRLPCG